MKDVARGIVNAIKQGEIGEAYIMGHQNLTYREMFDLIAATLQVKAPGPVLPRAVIVLSGLFGSIWSNLTGKRPQITYAMARISCSEQYYTAAKAIEHLDLPQSPLETAIRESFEWMQQNGVLDRD